MIFFTLGNGPLPFDRLAIKIDEIAPKLNEEVFVQFGHTSYEFKNATAQPFLNAHEMTEKIKHAKIVVSHGGWGTVSECLKLGKRIVAVPRCKGVEVNHSQEELVRTLEHYGYLLGVYTMDKLLETIEKTRHHKFEPIKRGSASRIINNFLFSAFKKK